MKIDRIEIQENNIYLDIYPKDNIVIIEGKRYTIGNDKIEDFYRIISNWNKENYSEEEFDGNIYIIKVYYDGKIDIIKGIGGEPKNYNEFSSFIRGIYDRR